MSALSLLLLPLAHPCSDTTITVLLTDAMHLRLAQARALVTVDGFATVSIPVIPGGDVRAVATPSPKGLLDRGVTVVRQAGWRADETDEEILIMALPMGAYDDDYRGGMVRGGADVMRSIALTNAFEPLSTEEYALVCTADGVHGRLLFHGSDYTGAQTTVTVQVYDSRVWAWGDLAP